MAVDRVENRVLLQIGVENAGEEMRLCDRWQQFSLMESWVYDPVFWKILGPQEYGHDRLPLVAGPRDGVVKDFNHYH